MVQQLVLSLLLPWIGRKSTIAWAGGGGGGEKTFSRGGFFFFFFLKSFFRARGGGGVGNRPIAWWLF